MGITELLQVTPDVIVNYGASDKPVCYFYMDNPSVTYLKGKGIDPVLLANLARSSGYWYFSLNNVQGQLGTRFSIADTITGRANLFVNGFRVPQFSLGGVLLDAYSLEERKLFFYLLETLFDNKTAMNRIMIQNALMNSPIDLTPTLRLQLPGLSGDFNILESSFNKEGGFNNYVDFSLQCTLKNIVLDHIPPVSADDAKYSFISQLESHKIVNTSADRTQNMDNKMQMPGTTGVTNHTPISGGFKL